MRRMALALVLLICLAACAEADPGTPAPAEVSTEPEPSMITELPSPTSEKVEQHVSRFLDEAVMREAERILEKPEILWTAEDFETLAFLTYLEIRDGEITTLDDLPAFFPSLRGISVYSSGLESLEPIRSLDYICIRYTEDATKDSNLGELSLLGEEFIQSRLTGSIKEVVRVTEDGRAYELFVTDHHNPGEEIHFYYEAKLIVSEIIDGEILFIDSFNVPERMAIASGGLILADVNFDGQTDILVKQGHWGSRGVVTYACFLRSGHTYKLNSSFSDISNPSIDVNNKRILSTVNSQDWVIYAYSRNYFIMTDYLTVEPDPNSDGDLIYTAMKPDLRETVYRTKDYTEEELNELLFNDGSFWELNNDKWHSLESQTKGGNP
ncbi:MAG: hypothetical protein FWG31_08275 [Oscillospiraceae bacterium]|nr:hypothetical protein [Oscillospiraceae bacterium]